MAYSTGLLMGRTTWTDRCDDYVAFFGGIAGFTLSADTGVGNARILWFTMRGTVNLLRISYVGTSSSLFAIVTPANVLLFNVTQPDWRFGPVYHIITNTNLVHANFATGTGAYAFTLGKAGSIYNTLVHAGLSAWYVHPLNASFLGLASNITPVSSRKTKTNKQIIIPYYPMSDDLSTTEDEPMINAFTFGNVDNVASQSIVSIGGNDYFIARIDTGLGVQRFLLKTSD